jgi:TPR repeat protein
MTSAEFNELIDKAKKGDRKAMLDVALEFNDGAIVEQSDTEFFQWVRKAAIASEPEAAYELAYAYRDGVGTQPDYDRFVEWLQEAARLEFPKAVYEIAIWYKEGENVPTDEEHFFKLMKKAAEGGYGDAMLELAFAFRDRIGTKRNLRSFLLWLTNAANEGNSEAMFHLAFEYKNREDNPEDNIIEFFRWLKRAAENAQPDALFHLAIAYLDGEGTEPSRNNYFRWMKKAAEAGIPAAMYHLAMSYLIKSRPDLQQFSEWIKRALKAGYPRAFIASGLDDLFEELHPPVADLVALNKDLNELFDLVIEIKRDHRLNNRTAKGGVYHFTRFEALESMLPVERSSEVLTNRLRLYNFAYMNDPQEGKRLLDKNIPDATSLRVFFTEEDDAENPISWEQHESSVYIGSFTLMGDELDMWRTSYGNNGQGYCIVTPLTAFDQESLDEPEVLHGGEVVNVTEGMLRATEFLSTTLYSIRYEEKDVRETLSKLKGKLDLISDKRSRLRGSTKTLDRTVRQIISHILYLYKTPHYESEMEARMISDYDISFEKLKLDSRERPSRVYVESPPFLLSEGSSIIIGPTVEKQTVAELDLKYRLARHGHSKLKVMRSQLTNMYR